MRETLLSEKQGDFYFFNNGITMVCNKFRKNELFGRFYDEAFNNVNGAQLVMAVRIYRYCDRLRKQQNLVQQYPHLPYSTYFLAMLIGKLILKETNKEYRELTHVTFGEVKDYFENNKKQLFQQGNELLIKSLNRLYSDGYEKIELRRLSATFRREDLLLELKKLEIIENK
ncbi:AIPR family protein [Schinkia azotoformans]|nr:AIPR family protein [Schinkia azotoformans]MEC1943947.1 AIPR family protein [Schinkia azotoformans]